MPRKAKRQQPVQQSKPNTIMNGSPLLWQTNDANQFYFYLFRSQIYKLALSRFKWIGLPDTCSERYLEEQLLKQGCATICTPANKPGIWTTLGVVPTGSVNMYDEPTAWRAIGANGTSFNVNQKNGVLVWDNVLHDSIAAKLDTCAWEMSDILRTKQVNRMIIKRPYILKGPRSAADQMQNLYTQVANNTPAIIVTDAIESMSATTEILNLDIPFLGKELAEDLRNTWEIVYQLLGITNLPYKTERQTEDEIKDYREPTDMQTLSSITCRRKAAELLNKRFGLDIHVVKAIDYESKNYNDLHEISTLVELKSKEDNTEDDGRPVKFFNNADDRERL